MFNFGIRKMHKQGGSYIISLPMQWLKDIGGEVKAVKIEMDTDKTLRIAPATPCKDVEASAFAVFLLFAKIVSCHGLNMLFSTLTSLSNVFMVLSSVLLSGKVYKTIYTINLKVIIMGGVIGPAEMKKIRKNREKKNKNQ